MLDAEFDDCNAHANEKRCGSHPGDFAPCLGWQGAFASSNACDFVSYDVGKVVQELAVASDD